MFFLFLLWYTATSSCLALVQQCGACRAPYHFCRHYQRALLRFRVCSSPLLFLGRMNFVFLWCCSEVQRRVCHCVLRSCLLDWMICRLAVACELVCRVFVVVEIFQEGVLVTLVSMKPSMRNLFLSRPGSGFPLWHC